MVDHEVSQELVAGVVVKCSSFFTSKWSILARQIMLSYSQKNIS